MRALRPHPVLAGIALAAMLASSTATAFALRCAFGCADMDEAAAAKETHSCCPGNEAKREPDPQLAIRAAMPDCCTYLAVADRAPRFRRDDVETSPSSVEPIAAPIAAIRLPAPPLREIAKAATTPAPPPATLSTATTVLLL